ncbi:hypothetical protein DEU56DRAFT_762168 [Suillus clintonianus]|uniref:uncharacterized protein n=1 Tax=Suillus clintonianus TaxID=1904413 RepID=UPI001B87F8C7|nr:uncharacterized protein DEU56DRAFT_762168 [Suillus clintonianus]KAG2111461.1 hypothetical protein DEU56DRAFT_762168 [Suillus clintonianus]
MYRQHSVVVGFGASASGYFYFPVQSLFALGESTSQEMSADLKRSSHFDQLMKARTRNVTGEDYSFSEEGSKAYAVNPHNGGTMKTVTPCASCRIIGGENLPSMHKECRCSQKEGLIHLHLTYEASQRVPEYQMAYSLPEIYIEAVKIAPNL